MKLLRKGSAIIDATLTSLVVLAAVILIFVMLSVNAEVIMRYFLNRPLLWVIEISEYSLLYITFLGTAWLLKKDGHVRMDLVLERLKPITQAVINITTSAILAIFCLILAWYGGEVTWEQFQVGTVKGGTILDFPLAAVLVVIPVGSFLLSIQFLRRSYGYLERWRADKEQGLPIKP